MSRNVSVNSEPQKYGQNVSVGPHVFHADEPGEYGGADEGPTAVELLMAALGTCASVTVQMYAERRQAGDRSNVRADSRCGHLRAFRRRDDLRGCTCY